MEQYISQLELKNYLILPKNFDWNLVDQENGFSRVFDIFPQSIVEELKDSEDAEKQKLYKTLIKAGVYYSFIFSIPKIKVQISNYGIQQFDQPKTKVAPWWDVRDLGLSMLKVADRCISDALTASSKMEDIKDNIPFFESTSDLLPTPAIFESIYSINHSPDLFLKLQKLIRKAYLIKVQEQIPKGCLEQVMEDKTLSEFLQEAVAFYALYYASLLPGFIFTQNAVVVQYEELPWQKSVVLDGHAKVLAGQNFLQLANSSLKLITDHLAKNPEEYPCFQNQDLGDRKIRKKDSGLYIL